MYRFFYSLLFYLVVPFIVLKLLWRSLKAPAYRRRWAERFALASLPEDFQASMQTIWIHAVSVGETVASVPLVRQLQQAYPSTQIMITTMTPTGSDRVVTLFGASVYHQYIPYDLPAAIGRFIDALRPTVLILMETELWPNTIHYCHRSGVRIILGNARLSARSASAYSIVSELSKLMLSEIDCIAAQSQADARRFIELGASPEAVEVTGSLKFNVEIDASGLPPGSIFESLKESGRTVLIAASTRDGEEDKILAAFAQCHQSDASMLLLLVPRHPERFDNVVNLCQQKGFTVERRSQLHSIQASLQDATQIIVGDSMGEMQNYYRCADIAFVGGSLVDTGCQNVLEPAALGIPVVVGPSQYNFANICSQLEQAGALRTVADETELARLLTELNSNKAEQERMGAAGKQLVQANQDALPAMMKIVRRAIG
jgi:3-deoxy-D-manno-octulosonic-acid transferase